MTQQATFTTTIISAITLAVASPLAAFVTVTLPGDSEYEGWAGLTGDNYDGYGSYPGMSPWPAPIASNQPSSDGNASFMKNSGTGYLGSASVYSSGTGDYSVSNNSALSGLETIVFQLDMGQGVGSGDGFFAPGGTPTLSYNGGSQALPADLVTTATGAYTTAFGGPPAPTSVRAFQWDLSSVSGITSYDINWTSDDHSQVFELQLNSGTSHTQVIPEPSTYALFLGGLAMAYVLQRRVRSQR